MTTPINTAPRTGQVAHTPAPFTTLDLGTETVEQHIGTHDGMLLATVHRLPGCTEHQPEHDAAFIVRAVNSHAELVAVLELCAKHADFSQCSADVEAAVDAALAKAKGGQP